ncbi:TlpA disulfide reductase family protein [Sphingobacterium sp. 18053]|uniref:TlpA family protein disulfide reductase n=1 Tax=Sphingobacterium sp. 18053 TaxID=2681401 RepID=UPI0013572D4B|nr:TlpA disulfide reductase family protein [Sphingobacterium sp. 18053]
MLKKMSCVFFLCILSLSCTFAQSPSLSSGFVTLVVKVRGDKNVKDLDLPIPFMSNPFQQDKPLPFKQVNDSTLMASAYSFGPSAVYMRLNGQYLAFMLVPKQVGTLTVDIQNGENSGLHYQGPFKEIFDNSAKQEKLLMGLFTYPSDKKNIKTPFKSANDFKRYLLGQTEEMTKKLIADTTSGFLREYYTRLVEGFQVPSFLLNYAATVYEHNKNAGLDSTKFPMVPTRDISFYSDILNPRYQDTMSLYYSVYSNVQAAILQDTLLHLPDITAVGPRAFRTQLQQRFDPIFKGQGNLFYEMTTASAFVQKMNKGYLLSPQDKYDITNSFTIKDLGEYLLYQDEQNVLLKQQSNSKVSMFPFAVDKEEVIEELIKPYRGKVVLVDLWATWCGPCIASFPEMEKVKKQYSDRDDVVFVYVTDESSDRKKFQEFTNLLEGDHYYLYKKQFAAIIKQFDYAIPSYLVFDKAGNLSDRAVFPENKTEAAKSWIEKALNK